MTEGDYASVGMVASERSRPRAKDLVQHTVIARGTCDPFVEHRNLRVAVSIERLKIDVSHNCPCRTNRIQKRLDDDVGATGNRPDRPDARMHHDDVPKGDIQPSKACPQ